ncbi:anti-sigma factor domain-containing protein [Amycolatopsis sp. GM8]|uniref:anti-sigma factor n=1 Tax=Amycolatopsis sp. GM8 TaxID=2896530 RepID=UPI001F4260B7|nr:anti-sigma factor [Amycolatopsis sp. GM8]
MTTPDVHLLTGAYVLDALDEPERRQFERHLAECPECVQEVAGLRETTVRLGLAVSETPPAGMKEQVLARIGQVRQEPPGIGYPRVPARRGHRWPVRLVSVAAAVAVAVAAALGVVAYQTQSRLDAARAQLSQVRSAQNAVAELLSAPDLRAIPAQGGRAGGGSVLVSRQLDRGLLFVSGMPDQPATSTYQAWVIADGTAKSIGVLGPAGRTATPLLFGSLGGADEVAMTIEPAGGSREPTTSPVVWFLL